MLNDGRISTNASSNCHEIHNCDIQIGPLVFIMNHRDMTKDSIVIRTAENYAVRVGYKRDFFNQSIKTFQIGTIHLRCRHFFRGGGVKNLPNLLTDSCKKLPTVGG